MKNYFAGFVLLTILFIIGYHFWTVVNFDNIKYVKIARQNVKVELALTNMVRERGLSGRKELKENEGMLFVFDRPSKYSFWMKNMNFSVDIIWLGEDLRVVYIKKDARPELYPETYTPTENAKYVLEVPAGFSEKNNLKVGDSASFLTF